MYLNTSTQNKRHLCFMFNLVLALLLTALSYQSNVIKKIYGHFIEKEKTKFLSAVDFRNMPTLQINMTSCNERDELFDPLLLMDTVLDNP